MIFAVEIDNKELKEKAYKYLDDIIKENQNIQNRGEALMFVFKKAKRAKNMSYLKYEGIDTTQLEKSLTSIEDLFMNYATSKAKEHQKEIQKYQEKCGELENELKKEKMWQI